MWIIGDSEERSFRDMEIIKIQMFGIGIGYIRSFGVGGFVLEGKENDVGIF